MRRGVDRSGILLGLRRADDTRCHCLGCHWARCHWARCYWARCYWPAGTVPGPLTAPAPAAPPLPATDQATLCPDCGEPRPGPLARFCDNCRFDFVTGLSFSATKSPAPIALEPPPPAPPPAAAVSVVATSRYDLIATVDVSLRKPEDPNQPICASASFPSMSAIA